jgi:hypothetical protein
MPPKTKVKKKRSPPWEHCAAKDLLRRDILDGLAADKMTGREVYNMHPEEYGIFPFPNFSANLSKLRAAIKVDAERMKRDCEFYGHDRGLLVTLRPDPLGSPPLWHLSEARTLLIQDVTDGKHLGVKPADLRLTRPEYQLFSGKVFRKHIYQEIDSRLKKAWRYKKKKTKQAKNRAKAERGAAKIAAAEAEEASEEDSDGSNA